MDSQTLEPFKFTSDDMEHITSYINYVYGVKEGAQLTRLVKKLCEFILKQIDCYGADMGDKLAIKHGVPLTTVEYWIGHLVMYGKPGYLWKD